MRTLRLLPLLLLVLCEPALATDVVAEVEVASIDLSGVVAGTGVLRAYVDVARAHGQTDLLLRLDAEAAVVTVHEKNTTRAPDFQVTDVSEGGPSHRRHADVALRAVAVRPDHEWGVFPLPGHAPVAVEVQGGCARTVAAEPGEASVENRVQSEPGPTAGPFGYDPDRYAAEVGESLLWQPCDGRVTLRGDLRLVLWETDVEVRGDDGTTLYRSGVEEEPLADPRVPASRATRRQVVVDATNATLEASVPDSGRAALFLDAAAFRVDGSLVAQWVRGRVSLDGDWAEVDLPTLEVSGSLLGEDAGGARDAGESVLRVRLAGRIDASPQGVSVPGPEPPAGVGWPVFLVLAVASVAVACTHAWRAREGPAFLAASLRRTASRCVETHRLRAASVLSHAAIRLDRGHGDGYVLRAIVRATAGRLAAAVQDHQRAHHRLGAGHARALNAFEAARVCGLLGRASEAAHWLSIAVRLEPRLLDEAAMDPDFGRVAADGAFRRILGNLLPDGGATA